MVCSASPPDRLKADAVAAAPLQPAVVAVRPAAARACWPQAASVGQALAPAARSTPALPDVHCPKSFSVL